MNPTDHSFRRGIAAGLLGTAAYTAVSYLIKKRLPEVAASRRPADVATSLVGGQVSASAPTGETTSDSRMLNAALHWGYGAAGGATRALLERRGLTGWRLESAHFAAIWLPWRALVLAQGRRHRVDQRAAPDTAAPAALALDVLKHAVYVYATGRAFHLLRGRRR